MPALEQSPSAQIPVAALLAITGGLLDGVTYFAHGHVFANAMTGNLILLGIAAVSQDREQVIRHIVPLVLFLVGIFFALRLRDYKKSNAELIALLAEIGTLGILGALPGSFPNLIFIGAVSFISAFQVTTFHNVGQFSYSSTFITGNLRQAAGGFYDSIFSSDPVTRDQSRSMAKHLSLICACFLVGACLGAFVAQHHPGHSILAAEPMLLIVLGILLISRHQ